MTFDSLSVQHMYTLGRTFIPEIFVPTTGKVKMPFNKFRFLVNVYKVTTTSSKNYKVSLLNRASVELCSLGLLIFLLVEIL